MNPAEPLHRRPVSPEAFLLSLICLADLVTTLALISHGHAREGNPWMAGFLDRGAVPFIVAKLCMFVPAIVAAEWYRPRKPLLITSVMRVVIVAYLLVYVLRVGPEAARRFYAMPGQ